ncbi:MAG: hypothetical protein P8R43_08585, partial [Planctomycetota bacterium]|nr:hypothetical protein [Planctomycetota bacterium]
MTDSNDAKTSSRGSGASKSGGEPPKRELEQAPLLLRKASVVLMCGAALPWMTAIMTKGNMPWASWFGSWALTFVAGWLLLDGAKARFGAKSSGIGKALVKAHALAPVGAAMILFVTAIVICLSTGVYFNKGEFIGFVAPTDAELAYSNEYLPAALEFGTLFLALATFAHLTAYEYGGKFNPLFPLLFLGPAVAGVLKALDAASQVSELGVLGALGLIGSVGVATGGIMAMY